MKQLTRHMMEVTITNLEPGHEYEFMVLSQDRYGDGMFSKAFKYWTKRKTQLICAAHLANNFYHLHSDRFFG